MFIRAFTLAVLRRAAFPAIASVILSALSVPHSASAQSRDFDCAKPLKTDLAEKKLTELQTNYAKIGSLLGDFRQYSYLAALDTGETSSGEMKFLKPGRMQWHYSSPDDQYFTVTGETLEYYQVTQNQVLIDAFSSVLLTDLPISFIMGIGDITKDFTVASACDGKEGMIVSLKAKDEKKAGALEGLKLLLDIDHSLPIGAEVTDVSGNITAVTLKNLKPGAPLEARDFEMRYPSGTDITDRRNDGRNRGEG